MPVTFALGSTASYLVPYCISLAALVGACSLASRRNSSSAMQLTVLAAINLCGLPISPLFFPKIGLLCSVFGFGGYAAAALVLANIFYLWFVAIRWVMSVASGESSAALDSSRSSIRADRPLFNTLAASATGLVLLAFWPSTLSMLLA